MAGMSRPLKVTRSARLDASTDAAYSFLADGRRRPDWLRELAWTDAPARELKQGDRFRGRTSLLLHSFLGESTVVRADPGHALVEEVVIGARFTSTWEVRPDGAGTSLSHAIEVDFPSGPLGLIARWILRRRLAVMQRHSLSALSNLRQ